MKNQRQGIAICPTLIIFVYAKNKKTQERERQKWLLIKGIKITPLGFVILLPPVYNKYICTSQIYDILLPIQLHVYLSFCFVVNGL